MSNQKDSAYFSVLRSYKRLIKLSHDFLILTLSGTRCRTVRRWQSFHIVWKDVLHHNLPVYSSEVRA